MKDSRMLKAALRYAELGLAVFPIKAGHKKPPVLTEWHIHATTDPEIIKKWWSSEHETWTYETTKGEKKVVHSNPNYNIGFVTGEKSNNVVVLDLDQHPDQGKYGINRAEDWQRDHGLFPDSWRARTGSGGLHLFYRIDEDRPREQHIYNSEADFQAHEAYVILPPSLHPSGERYKWEVSPKDQALADIDENVLAFIAEGIKVRDQNKMTGGACSNTGADQAENGSDIPEGKRTDTLVSLALSLESKGISFEGIKNLLRYENETRCVPPLTDEELEKEVFPAIGRYNLAAGRQLNTSMTGADLSRGLYRVVGAMANKGLTEEAIRAAIEAQNNQCDKPLTAEQLEANVFPAIEKYGANKKAAALQDNEEDTGDTLNYDYFHRWSAPTKSGETHPVGLYDSRIVEHILSNNCIIKLCGKMYIYRGGVYTMDEGGEVIKSLISEYAYPEIKKAKAIKDVYELLTMERSIVRGLDEINKHPKHWVNFKNGMLDLKTLELHPHDPKYLSIYQIPHEWHGADQWNEDTVVKDFLEGLVPDPADREMLLQFIGYSMTIDMHLQRFLIITGSGGLGKSVLLNAIQCAIGEKNYTAMSLQKLNERFTSAFLVGKSLNIYADIPSTSMKDVSMIKTITGGDEVQAEYKGANVFKFKPFCKLIFSANQIPHSQDDGTDAYYRRLLILPILRRAPEIDNLEERLEKNIDDLIRLAVLAVHKMYTEQHGKITVSDNSAKAVEDLYMSTDTVFAWLRDTGKVKSVSDNDYVTRDEAYREYERYCIAGDRLCKSRQGFCSSLREKGFTERKRNGVRGFLIGVDSHIFDTSAVPDDLENF